MAEINVEVVFAEREKQRLRSLIVKQGTTAAEAITASGVAAEFPDFDFDSAAIGIWGREVPPDQVVENGDRIEIYRSLELEPREARRRLALSGKTMGNADSD